MCLSIRCRQRLPPAVSLHPPRSIGIALSLKTRTQSLFVAGVKNVNLV
jgi:hypothetical protein